jgi:hypothetical protein
MMTDEQLLEYRRVKLLGRDKQISELIAVNIKLREDLREEISLRDHFAGLTLQGTLARTCPNVDTIAQFAYGIADKMMAEREKDSDN